MSIQISIGMSREKAIEFFAEGLAEAQGAQGDGDLDFSLYGESNTVDSPDAIRLYFNNDDMENRDDLPKDAVFVDVQNV